MPGHHLACVAAHFAGRGALVAGLDALVFVGVFRGGRTGLPRSRAVADNPFV
jgi:hypothetical protein